MFVRLLLSAAVLCPCLKLAAPSGEAAPGSTAGLQAFEALKGLAGEWVSKEDPNTMLSRMQVTAGGSAVLEVLFPGSDHEMVSVYYVDGGELVMTHYCMMQNQPHFRASYDGDTTLTFTLDGGTNLDPAKDSHVHGGTMHWAEDGSVVSSWSFYDGGKETSAEKFEMVRRAAKP